MKQLLVRLGLWLAQLGGWSGYALYANNMYMDDAHRLVRAADRDLPHAGGEAKRHQVYAQLIKLYPDASHRDLALAIELAVRS